MDAQKAIRVSPRSLFNQAGEMFCTTIKNMGAKEGAAEVRDCRQ
jgi:hypothetical protein